MEIGIKASFEIDDSTLHLDDNFTVLLDGPIQKITCRIAGDTLFVPNNLTDTIYKVIFTYKEAVLAFKNVHRLDIVPGQRVHWVFGIDNQPFNTIRGAAFAEDLEPGLYSKIEFLMFDLQERGDGLLFRNKIK